jgi:hypothetical protein
VVSRFRNGLYANGRTEGRPREACRTGHDGVTSYMGVIEASRTRACAVTGRDGGPVSQVEQRVRHIWLTLRQHQLLAGHQQGPPIDLDNVAKRHGLAPRCLARPYLAGKNLFPLHR